MFGADFYPTPPGVIDIMLHGEIIENKTILEPSAGKGNIVDYLKSEGAKAVLACEINEDLRAILAGKCKIIANDFLTVTSDQISHIQAIYMNPPFSADEKHVLHAYDIAPPGCRIVSLCNSRTIQNTYSENRKRLKQTIEDFGSYKELGPVFDQAERKTGVEVTLIKLTKPGAQSETEYQGFFLDEDSPELEQNALMQYNVVRDLVNRYVAACKIFDEQLNQAVKMNNLLSGFYHSELAMSVKNGDKDIKKEEFKKDLQKSGWHWIFNKMNLQKHMTRGLKEDINKFVEQQTQIPFTMKNIYRMLEIVIGTSEQRMDKAILEAFEAVTSRSHDNRYNLPGWKTNSHYVLNEKFILDYMVEVGFRDDGHPRSTYYHNYETIQDLVKALCFITGVNYDTIPELNRILDQIYFGEWSVWGFFRIKCFKKGTMHFQFKEQDVWARFNQRISKLKGFPLPEHMTPGAKEAKAREKAKGTYTPTARQQPRTEEPGAPSGQSSGGPVVLKTIKIKVTEPTI